MLNHLKQHFGSRRTGGHGGLDIARHIGPGLLVTVGFIDPGNWASNMAAGSQFGYALLWIVTLSTIMLIALQHNAAHLGIATGTCLAEATTRYLPRIVGRAVLASAYLATIGVVWLALGRFVLWPFLTDASPDTFRIATLLLCLAVLQQFAKGSQNVLVGLLRGVKDTKSGLKATLWGYWLVGVPALLFFGLGLNWEGYGVWTGLI